jgi:hypothetical protein
MDLEKTSHGWLLKRFRNKDIKKDIFYNPAEQNFFTDDDGVLEWKIQRIKRKRGDIEKDYVYQFITLNEGGGKVMKIYKNNFSTKFNRYVRRNVLRTIDLTDSEPESQVSEESPSSSSS